MQLAKYIGIPYKDRARSECCVDCWGLVCLFYRNEFGIELPQYTTETPEGQKYVAEVVAGTRVEPTWKKVTQPTLGDVLLFRVQGLPTHVGIALKDNEFLHSFPNRDSCIERLDSLSWTKRLDGAYRWLN
jgi:cell wall-associated NlpC family hydrolase